MKHIPNIANEESLKALHRAKKRSMEWGEFSHSPGGHELRLNKAREQKGMCGYCECLLTDEGITEFKKEGHLDHFYPRNKGVEAKPQLQYDWDNLILSCTNNDSCGKHKDSDHHNILPSQIINPRHENPRDYITFVIDEEGRGIEGWKYVTAVARESLGEDMRRRAQNTIDALNLNSMRLRVRRKNALVVEVGDVDAYEEQLASCSSEDEIDEIRKWLLEYENSLEEKEFSSTLLSYAHSKWGEIT